MGRNREVDTVTQTAEAQECTACWVTVALDWRDDPRIMGALGALIGATLGGLSLWLLF